MKPVNLLVIVSDGHARALRDQARKIAELGGEAALLKVADFNHTPLPATTGGVRIQRILRQAQDEELS